MQIAIITAVSVVLAALITAIATGMQKKRESSGGGAPDLVSELTRRAVSSETHASELEGENHLLQARVDVLEQMLWRNGVDPATGARVK